MATSGLVPWARSRLPPMVSPGQGVALRVTRAGELPPLLTHGFDGRGGWVALAQFVQDWNRHPESRRFMMRDPLPAETDPERGAAIAAVVHSLCIRDALPVPDWVLAWRNDTPVTLASGIGMESSFGRSVRVRSPAVCEYHGVFFEVSFRDHG